jgi:hypothetical protein
MVLLRRLSVLVILVAAFGCRSSNPNRGFVDQCAGTFHGNPNGYAPLVCVGVTGSTATPLIDPLHVYPHGKNGAAVKIVWASADPRADLHISMKNPSQNCVKSVRCPQKQACTATVVTNAAAGTQCEYELSNGSGRPMDPIIIVDTCCPDQ